MPVENSNAIRLHTGLREQLNGEMDPVNSPAYNQPVQGGGAHEMASINRSRASLGNRFCGMMSSPLRESN